MPNLWIKTNFDSDSEQLWYIDYDNNTAIKKTKENNESIRKWKGTIIEFLEHKELKIQQKNENEIIFSV